MLMGLKEDAHLAAKGFRILHMNTTKPQANHSIRALTFAMLT
jgi:hypothetical protein